MREVILVLNAGSSSIKFCVFDVATGSPAPVMRGQVEGLYTSPRFAATDARGAPIATRQWDAGVEFGHDVAVAWLVEFLGDHSDNLQLVAIGHRVVHGGVEFSEPVLVTPEVMSALAVLVPLAPLHQPHNLKAIEVVARLRPDLAQVACFDTAFHHGQPRVARAFALPPAITDRGVQRYGFHGLSYEYIASVLAQYDARAASGRTLVAHLGNGSSMCAMVAGRSVATSMGFTAVDGLVMGTRCGNIDPGVILYLIDELGMDVRAIETLVYKQSGLLGVSGISSDMRTLLESRDERAAFAVDLYAYRCARELGSLAAAAGGLDAVVFTAGIGEHAPAVRARICQQSAWLGVELDAAANQAGGPRISTSASPIPAWVIPTDEEVVIARHALRVVGAERPGLPSLPLAQAG